MKKFYLLFVIFTGLLFPQNKNNLLNGIYILYEINSFEGDVSTAVSQIDFNGIDSAHFEMISPEYGDYGDVSYNISETGEIILDYGDIVYRGSVKSDGNMFFIALTDSVSFSDYGIGIGIKFDSGFQQSDFMTEYLINGYIPTSQLKAFSFAGGPISDSTFSYTGDLNSVFSGDLLYSLQDGFTFFNANGFVVGSTFNSDLNIGVGCKTEGSDAIFSAVSSNINDGAWFNKKYKFAQFLSGDYDEAAILELNCFNDGTGNYTKLHYSNNTGELTGNFTYNIINNVLRVFEDNDTLIGTVSEDLGVCFLSRENEYTAGFGIGIEEINPELSVSGIENLPAEFSLSQNYPNPFNPVTTIKYSIPESPLSGGVRGGLVTLKIYDILGREVATLVNKQQSAGNYEVKFDASNLASGIYLYKLQAGEFSSVKKLILMK